MELEQQKGPTLIYSDLALLWKLTRRAIGCYTYVEPDVKECTIPLTVSPTNSLVNEPALLDLRKKPIIRRQVSCFETILACNPMIKSTQ